MPTAINAQPLIHPNVLKLRFPHLVDCRPRSRPSHVPHRRSPLAPPIDNDFHNNLYVPQCSTLMTTIPITKDVSSSHLSQNHTVPTPSSRSQSTYCRTDASASSHRSSSSSEGLYAVVKLLQNSLEEVNADKEWLWSVLEDAWADNKRICAALEKAETEKAQVVLECEKIWEIVTHLTAEVKVLKQKLAQYEASAEAGREKYVT